MERGREGERRREERRGERRRKERGGEGMVEKSNGMEYVCKRAAVRGGVGVGTLEMGW